VHDYNPQTGEELNVVVENTTDRPFYAREYMRVDWSSNKVASAYSFDPIAGLRGDQGELEPLVYRNDDPESPDALVLDAAGGYLDVTNRYSVKPSTVDGMLACQLPAEVVVGGTYPFVGCDPAEISVRTSFLRIARPGEPGDRDYEPREWDGARMNAFGAFVQERIGYDANYGVVDNKWHRFVQRYNVWQASHTAIPCVPSPGVDLHADTDSDGTEDVCRAAPAGSRCDDLVGRCTIPYAQRLPRVTAWHYNFDAGDDAIFEATAGAAEEWDTALRVAVQAARRVECERTAGRSVVGSPFAAAGDCTRAFPLDLGDEVELASVRVAKSAAPAAGTVAAMAPLIVLCHNPVAAADDPACGPAGLRTRPGDLRYHQVNVVPTPQSQSPWGYGPSAADPLTGEVIGASINVWDSVTDLSAQAMVDQVRWIGGELSASQITSGSYVLDWAGAATARVPGSSPLVGKADVQALAGASGPSALDLQKIRASVQSNVLTGRTRDPSSAARIAEVRGTALESALAAAPWLEMAGQRGKSAADPDVLDLASPLRGLDMDKVADAERRAQGALAEHGQCLVMAPEPTAIVPLAKVMAKKFPYDANASETDKAARIARMRAYLKKKLHYGVIAHEMGHTFGLAHNFASSWDKMSYRPQYWQLRTRGGTITKRCDGPTTDGASCIGPRYYDPLDQDEVDQMIWLWAGTSIMEYPGETTQDTLGLGVYDMAAVRSLYADVVDVRDDGVRTRDPVGRQQLGQVDSATISLSDWVSETDTTDPKGYRWLHYSEWARFFGHLRGCRPVEALVPAAWDAAKDGAFDPVFDGHVVRGERCDRVPVALVDWRDMVPDMAPPRANYDPRWIVARRAEDAAGRPRMPYASVTDAWADSGLPSANRNDSGAELYEEVAFFDDLYEDRHFFDDFRRGRSTFSLYGAYQRQVSRYHARIRDLATLFAFYHDVYLRDAQGAGVSRSDITRALEGPGGPMQSDAVGGALAFDHFVRVLSRPEPGPHNFGDMDDVLHPMDGAAIGTTDRHAIDIPEGSAAVAGQVSYGGRALQNGYGSFNGYWNTNQIGSYYEKTHVAYNRWTTSSFVSAYPEGIRRLLGAALTGDAAAYAPRVAADARGLPKVTAGPVLYPEGPIGWTSFVPDQAPVVCFSADGQRVCQGDAGAPAAVVALDPELGYEVQKFVLLWSYAFLPANDEMDWIDSMRIYKVGTDVDPSYLPADRTEWRDPESGLRYAAKKYGSETIFGRTYDRGIAAKMLSWANQLCSRAYAPSDAAAPFDPATGAFVPAVDPSGAPVVAVDPGVLPSDPTSPRCDENRFCRALRDYRGLLDFSRDMAARVGFPDPSYNGIYRP
jgi:hypothetical protein